MYCFNFFRNQLWQHLISYNSFRNVNMCLLEVAICEKCRSNHFQLEWGGGWVKALRTLADGGGGIKNIRTWGVTNSFGGGYFWWVGGGLVPHYMPCLRHTAYHCLLPQSRTSRKKIVCTMKARIFMKLIMLRLVCGFPQFLLSSILIT